MRLSRKTLTVLTILTLVSGVTLAAGPARGGETGPASIPAIKTFLGNGFGAIHTEAPGELKQFGRLAGIWKVEVEMRKRDGGWAESAPGIWAWKYTLDGFAVTDLWFQPADGLPAYMASLGRDYLLSGIRIFEASTGKWRVAWMANGVGKTPGADFGIFEAGLESGELIMISPPTEGVGLQRVVFHDFGKDSFRWKSEYSQDDGKTWNTIMRMIAHRIAPAD